MRLKLVFIALAAAISAAPATAQSQQKPNPPAQSGTGAANPDEIICEKTEETGSRLGAKRVCMRRSEWADRRNQDRQEIEKAQISRGIGNGN